MRADGSFVSASGRAVPVERHVGTVETEACVVCGDRGPQLTYYYPGGLVLRLHAFCDVLWQEERAR